MGCEGNGIVTIIKGEDRDILLRITDKATSQPFDLTAANAINARFKNQDDTVLIKPLQTGSVSIISAPSGKISVSLSAAETALLKAKEAQDFEVEISIGTPPSAKLTVVQFLQALTVKSRVV